MNLLGVLLLLFPAQAPAQVKAPKPVAMVLEADGKATLRRGAAAPQPLREMDLLKPDDGLEAGPGGVLLVVLADGHSERLAGGKRASVGREGCTPADAVERGKGRLPEAELSRLRGLAERSKAGVAVLRSPDVDRIPAVRPLFGDIVATPRPTLTWPAAAGAVRYEVRLYSSESRVPKDLVWKAVTTEPRLPYPEKEPDLLAAKTGVGSWTVTTVDGAGKEALLVESKFNVPTTSELEELAALKPLAASKDPNDWLLAAAAYQAYGAYGEALPLYEKLAKERDQQGNYQATLAHYYLRAGLPDRAEEARQRAEKLGVKVEVKTEMK